MEGLLIQEVDCLKSQNLIVEHQNDPLFILTIRLLYQKKLFSQKYWHKDMKPTTTLTEIHSNSTNKTYYAVFETKNDCLIYI